MGNIHSPLVSEFEISEQEPAYTTWLQQKIQVSLNDTRANLTHDEVINIVHSRCQFPNQSKQ